MSRYRVWNLIVADDGALETTQHATESQAWLALIDEHRSDIAEWVDNWPDIESRITALTDDDQDEIRDGLEAAGIDIKVEEDVIDVTGLERIDG